MQGSIPRVRKDRDRRGNVRLYFQAHRKARKVRIDAAEGSAEFFARYHELLAEQSAAEVPAGGPGPPRPLAGTFRWLCVEYMKAAVWNGLGEGTQAKRRKQMESIWDEPVHPGAAQTFGETDFVDITTKALRVLRDRKSDAPEAANHRVKILRGVFKWALIDEHVAANPARDLAYIKTGSSGFHTWEVEEVRRYEACHPIGTKARLALALLMWTGVRRSDVVLLGKQHVRNGWLKFRQVKGQRRKPKVTEIPILTELQEVIAASPCGELTFLVTDYGRPFTAGGFGERMRKWCREAGLTECSSHGLRKAAAVIAAENGATSQQLMAIFGWEVLTEAERYTKAADRKKMAGNAMGLLVRKA